MPLFQRVRHGTDWVWGFDIDTRYHGYTRNQQTFHVYDENTGGYTSYNSPADFLAWLSSYKGSGFTPGITEVKSNGDSKEFGLMPGVKPWQIVVPLAAIGVLIYAVK